MAHQTLNSDTHLQYTMSSAEVIFIIDINDTLWFLLNAAAAAKSLQSCLTLCDPIDGSPPGSRVPGILQARTLEWVAISFSNAWKWKVKSLSRVQLFAAPWTAPYQAPPTMGFSRQEYWSGLPLLNAEVKSKSTQDQEINEILLFRSLLNLLQYFFCLFWFVFFFLATRHVGSQLPNQESNPFPLHSKAKS